MSHRNNNKRQKYNHVHKNDEEYSEIVDEHETRVSKRTLVWESQKYFYAFAYFLFFVPLFMDDTRRTRFYVNQGIMVWLWLILGNIALYYIGFIPAFTPVTQISQWVYSSIIFLLALYGFIATLLDRRDVRLPVIGWLDIVK